MRRFIKTFTATITTSSTISNVVKIKQKANRNTWKVFSIDLSNDNRSYDQKPVLVEINKESAQTDLRHSLTRIFLPRDYPHSVTRNYLRFSMWNVITSVSGSVSSVISTQCMLLSLGFGSATSVGLSATLNWVIKDGLGLLGGVLYTAVLSGKFDAEPKRYRWIASIFFQVATLCELLTPLVPQYFLLFASTANIAKNIAWLTISGTRAQMHQSLATKYNLADITSKSGSQSTAAGLLGTGLAIGASTLVAGSSFYALSLFVPLSIISLVGVYQSNRCVPTTTINVQRGELVIKHLLDHGKLLSPAELCPKENFVLPFRSVFRKTILIFDALITVVPSKHIGRIIQEFKRFRYAVHIQNDKVYLWFTDDASPEDIIRGFYEASLLRYKMEGVQYVSEPPDSAKFVLDLSRTGWRTSEINIYSNKVSLQ